MIQPCQEETIVVLVVDDDPRFRQGILRLLRMRRGRPTMIGLEAGSGEEALARLGATPVDCLLLDNRMPGGDGLEWLDRLLRKRLDLPIVMVTGEGDEQTAVAALTRGAMDYLVKGGLTPEGLDRALLNALEKARLRREVERQREALLDAERQRVMTESLATVCHHIGQPATVLRCGLTLLERACPDPETRSLLESCEKAADEIAALLEKLQALAFYHPVDYLPNSAQSVPSSRLIDVTPKG